MQRKRGELIPVAEAFSDLSGPVAAIREASPQAHCHLRAYDTFTVHRNKKKFPTGDLLGLDRLDVNERFALRNGGGVPCFVSKPVRSGKGRAGPKSPSASGTSTKISSRGGYECSTTRI